MAKPQTKAVEEDVQEESAPLKVGDDQVREALVALAQNQPIKQIPISKALIQTPFNPTGRKNRPKYSRTTRLNGFRLTESRSFDREIQLFNQLKPGKYGPDRKWIVVQRDDAEGAAIDVYIPNKTVADRIGFKAIAPTLADALQIMVNEASAVTA